MAEIVDRHGSAFQLSAEDRNAGISDEEIEICGKQRETIQGCYEKEGAEQDGSKEPESEQAAGCGLTLECHLKRGNILTIKTKGFNFMLTRDINLDWGQVPEMGMKLPAGVIQFKILGYEEKMSSGEGLTAKGEQKVAKYMIQCHLEAVAPEEAVGGTREEYFVLGSNDDPLMQKAETFYGAIGARQLKRMLGDAQVPWSASLVATLNSSIGAMFLMQIKHKIEKARDGSLDESTGKVREFVGVDSGRTYKLAEMQPKLVPCGLAQCEQCRELSGNQGTGMVQATPASVPTMPSVPPVATMPAAAPTSIPTMPVPPQGGPSAAVPPTVQMPSAAAPRPPVTAAVTPPVAPPVQPAAPAPAPPQQFLCRLCGMNFDTQAELVAHLPGCATGTAQAATGGFKQEV